MLTSPQPTNEFYHILTYITTQIVHIKWIVTMIDLRMERVNRINNISSCHGSHQTNISYQF